ncbi:hypothetical protein M5K25_007337 [Dendrobium thyrsiflorum]|uniref:Uncharacterized protein n=1 Tax=Dendrobium thyrsiflorum TaxID=117978 RepID=A0ABD0VKZ6_DENTH
MQGDSAFVRTSSHEPGPILRLVETSIPYHWNPTNVLSKEHNWNLPDERYGAGKLVKICGQQSRKVWAAKERLLGAGQQAWGCRNPLDSNGTSAEHSGQQAGTSRAAIRRAGTARQQASITNSSSSSASVDAFASDNHSRLPPRLPVEAFETGKINREDR